ncbi:hypothetical protein TARUN_5839 [Trichoderma arundinaceum]|uniref:Uncharacterized protein n=1 Tax=Trichoderma arundinaceum TaxID=490622 RepID=A0A395NKQ9_TRIAR|nr:hypothetical protein TARUN_5839 [Trichoderma arundinaceum]
MSSNSSNLLQSVIDVYGGQKYWESVQSLNVDFEFSGPALEVKGHPGPHKVQVIVDTKTKKVTFKQFGGYYGSWTPTRTEVGKIGSHDALDVRENPKEPFNTHTGDSKWDIHNLFWFVGYAFWNYFNFPFNIADSEIQTREVGGLTHENGEEWRSLEAVFSDGYPTHTKVQKFDFDDGYRLRRMHYSVDVMKNGVPVWHNCYNHAVAGNLIYPTLRVVSVSAPGMSFYSPFVLRGIKIEVNQS